MIYLPDTNAWSVWVRGTDLALANRIQTESRLGHIYLCSVVAAELKFGAVYKAYGVRNMARIEHILDSYTILPFDDACIDAYVALRVTLQRAGKPIGPNDMLIAAIALTHGLTVVTHKTGEFSRVAGLSLEDWQGSAS